MTTSENRTCLYCGEPLTKPTQKKFCSRQCSGAYKTQQAQVEIYCEQCGQPFTVRKADIAKGRKFCSHECYAQYRSKHYVGDKCPAYNGGPVEYTCKQCGDKFLADPSNNRKFCSRKCYNEWAKGRPKPREGNIWTRCETCGEPMFVHQSRIDKAEAVFCSYECRSIWYSENFSGSNSPQWVDGNSLEPYPPEFNYALKQRIRQRDEVCQVCGAPETDDSHCVHHINYDKNDLRERNLVLLCRSCHTKTNHNREYWQAFFERKVDALYPLPTVTNPSALSCTR